MSLPPPAGGFGYGGGTSAFGPVGPSSPHPPSAQYAHWTFAIGALSIIGMFFCLLGLPFGVGAIGMGVHSLKRCKAHPDLFTGRSYAIAGIVCGSISVLLTVAFLVVFSFLN